MSLVLAAMLAYHSAALFEKDASEGGGGGVLYTDSPRYDGFDCAACHLDSPGKITLAPGTDPVSLLTQREYEPGAVYEFTVALQGETKGLGTKGNYNAVALEVLDADGEHVGGFFGYDADAMITLAGGGALFSRGTRDQTTWTFSWQAPEAGAGYLDFYLVAVDGDGAGDFEATASDPLNDDVVAGGFRVAELGSDAPAFDRSPEAPGDEPLGRNRDVSACAVVGSKGIASWWICVLLLLSRRRVLRPLLRRK